MLQYTKTFPRQHDLDNDIESIIGRLDECLGEGNDPTKPSGLNYQVEPNPLLEELKSGLNGNDERVTPSRSEEIASGRKFDTELDHSHANVSFVNYKSLRCYRAIRAKLRFSRITQFQEVKLAKRNGRVFQTESAALNAVTAWETPNLCRLQRPSIKN